MNILKKLLRGSYYFCVGVKSSCCDFYEWYIDNRSIPGCLRNKVALIVMALVIVGAGWGLVAAIGSASSGERHQLPSSSQQSSSSTVSDSGESSASEPAASHEAPSDADSAVSDASSEAVPAPSESTPEAIDAMASATRYTPFTAEELTAALAERAKSYYEHPVFIPPAAGDIAGWKEVNPDVVGWISISNTNINYPLVIGQYTDYYTHRGYYKEASRNGVIWFDSDTRFDAQGNITSTNAVLYGHNWTNCWRPTRVGNPNDVMFAQLAAYDHADFTAQNPYIRIATLGGESLYQIFAVFYTDLSFGYNYAERPGNGMMNIINTAKAKSIHKLDVPVTASDKILTLSTCTRVMGAGDNQRFVVMAKKIS